MFYCKINNAIDLFFILITHQKIIQPINFRLKKIDCRSFYLVLKKIQDSMRYTANIFLLAKIIRKHSKTLQPKSIKSSAKELLPSENPL